MLQLSNKHKGFKMLEKIRAYASKKNINLVEFDHYDKDLVELILNHFELKTNGTCLWRTSKKTGKKTLLPTNSHNPYVFGNILVHNINYFFSFYKKNYDLEIQEEQKKKDKEYEDLLSSETFFCTGCGMWKPTRERKGYMWCGC